MNEQNIQLQSIFNIIEENKDKPELFTWSKDLNNFLYNPTEILYNSKLITINSCGIHKNHKYLLTYQGLIKHKVKKC